MIVVPNSQLLDQWTEEIHRYSDQLHPLAIHSGAEGECEGMIEYLDTVITAHCATDQAYPRRSKFRLDLPPI